MTFEQWCEQYPDPLLRYSAQLKLDAFVSTEHSTIKGCFAAAKFQILEDLERTEAAIRDISLDTFKQLAPRVVEFYDKKKDA